MDRREARRWVRKHWQQFMRTADMPDMSGILSDADELMIGQVWGDESLKLAARIEPKRIKDLEETNRELAGALTNAEIRIKELEAGLKAVDDWITELRFFAEEGTEPVPVFQKIRSLIYRRVRHKGRGTSYTVLGDLEMQISKGNKVYGTTERPVREGDLIVAYRGDDGKLWGRFPDEFRDGRFERDV